MLDFHKENTTSLKNRSQVILPTFVLESLVIPTVLAPDVYMEDIADIICHLFLYWIKK